MRVLILFLLLVLPAAAQGPAHQFTAEVVTERDGVATTGRVCVDSGRMRMDTTKDGKPLIVIIRPDSGLMYQIRPETRSYVEAPLQDVNKFNAYTPTAQRRLMGSGTARGRACDRYLIQSGPNSYFFWVEKGTPIPVQMETADGRTRVRYDNVRVGPVSIDTFEVPAGYKKE